MELLVVLGILALLIGIVAPRAVDYLSGARSDTARIQIDTFTTALDLYRLDVGRYPSAEQGLDALVRKPTGVDNWGGPYLNRRAVPTDPWGYPYRYEVPGKDNAPYRILSLGADGREGGNDEDADIAAP